MKKPGGVFMQLHSKCNANAMQLQCNCIPIKSNDCNNNKKGFPDNPYIAYFAHYKKRSRERHETRNKRFANFLAVPKWKKIAP